MPYMNRLDFRDVSNARISARLKQVLVLVLAVLIGMLISVSCNAQGQVKQINGNTSAIPTKNIEQTLTS